jgi:hypothetical protein
LLGVLTACSLTFTTWGCQQPPCYYYYGTPPCGSVAPVPSTVQSGPVCDVPKQVIEGGTATADATGRGTVVQGSQRYPRVVVSEPADPPRVSWRQADPDGSLPTTIIEGGVSDSSVNR